MGEDAGVDAVAETSPADVVAEAVAFDATSDTSPLPDASPVIDASVPDVAKDAGPDVNGDASTGIQCGVVSKTCTLSSPTCCFDDNTKVFSCTSSTCGGTVPVECDFDSCPSGQICCKRGGASSVVSVKCETALACPGTSSQAVWVCNSLAPLCPGGKNCQPSGSLPGSYICF